MSCLRSAGIQAVIAKSFSFIFGRNLLTMNLFGVCIKEKRFYEVNIVVISKMHFNNHDLLFTARC